MAGQAGSGQGLAAYRLLRAIRRVGVKAAILLDCHVCLASQTFSRLCRAADFKLIQSFRLLYSLFARASRGLGRLDADFFDCRLLLACHARCCLVSAANRKLIDLFLEVRVEVDDFKVIVSQGSDLVQVEFNPTALQTTFNLALRHGG